MSSKIVCSECFKKQQQIDRLKQENASLKAKLRYEQRKITEGYFGVQTPSSKKPFTKNTISVENKNQGGAKVGHKGFGRKSFSEQEADVVQTIDASTFCPDCGSTLQNNGTSNRTVVDIQPVEIKKIVYKLQHKHCPHCKKHYTAKAPGVLPKCLFGNNLLAYIAIEHYLYGVPMGQLAKKLKIGYSTMIKGAHRLAEILKDVPDQLIDQYRNALVKHADETSWRNNGQNGYAWLFTTPKVSIFRLRKTRSGEVAKEVLGKKSLPGVLVVDRYQGYNQAPCNIQYCYAHLLRDVQKLEKEFPNDKQVKNFVEATAPVLSKAMKLRTQVIDKNQFRQRAANTKSEILKIMNAQTNHAGIQKIQNIFRENYFRLYHWEKNPLIPADNNLAERELRPLVIARKISFGSHSDAGAVTRETLMSVLVTLNKNGKSNVFNQFKKFLDCYDNNKIKSRSILFQNSN